MNHVEEDQLYSLIDRIDVGGDDRRGEEEDVREEQGFDNGMMSDEQKRSLGRYQKNAEWMAEVFSEAEGAQQLFDEFSDVSEEDYSKRKRELEEYIMMKKKEEERIKDEVREIMMDGMDGMDEE